MPKLGLIAIIVIGLIAAIVWQQHGLKQLSAENAELREHLNQDVEVLEKDQQLMRSAKAVAEQTQNQTGELIRLRAQVTRLRETERENARLKMERERLAKQLAQAVPTEQVDDEKENTPEQTLLRRKQRLAANLGIALIGLAERNDYQFPTELSAQFITMLDAISQSSTDSITSKGFELVYKGSFNDFKEGEAVRTVLVREKEPMQLANGQWAKVYVFVDGHVEVVRVPTSDSFAAMEERLLLSKP